MFVPNFVNGSNKKNRLQLSGAGCHAVGPKNKRRYPDNQSGRRRGLLHNTLLIIMVNFRAKKKLGRV
jgi:hypothetical protein